MRKGIFKDSLRVTVLSSLAQVLGLLITITIANLFGANSYTDSYYLAIALPDLLIGVVIGGAFRMVLVPLIVDLKSKYDNASVFSGKLLVWTVAFSCLIYLLLVIVSQVKLFQKTFDFSEDFYEFLFILAPISVIAIISSYLNAVCNSEKVFGFIEISNAIKNITVLLFIFFLNDLGVIAIVYGQLVGYFVAILSASLIFRKTIRRTITFKGRLPTNSFKGFISLSLYGISAFTIVRIDPFVAKYLASLIDQGVVTIFSISEKVLLIPTFLIGTAFTTVLMSYWSHYISNKQESGLKTSFENVLFSMNFVLIPVSFGLYYFSEDIATILFKNGKFSEDELTYVAISIGLFSFSVIPHYLHSVVVRILQINKDLKLNFLITLICTGIGLIIMVLVVKMGYGLEGLILSIVLSKFLSFITTLLVVKRRYLDLDLGAFVVSFGRNILSAILTILISSYIINNFAINLSYGILILVKLLITFVFFALISKFLNQSEMNRFISLIWEKVKN